MASSSNSPCAACKLLRRKCTQECVFAPYFPPDQPTKFANVHKVFGASNISKILTDLPPSHREEAVNSLAYEAEFRLRDPVYGCVGLVSMLQQKLRQMQNDLITAKTELVNYVGPSAIPLSHQQAHHQHMYQHPYQNISSAMGPYGMSPEAQAQAQLLMREQQQMVEAHLWQQQQQQQQQHEIARFNFDKAAEEDGVEFNQLSAEIPLDNPFQVQPPQQEHSHQQ